MIKLPNFFIIGAPKCGTTSLVAWLREHPNVYMSPWKEPRYFDSDLKARFRISWSEYKRLYEGASEESIALGEATVWYLYSKEAIKNIEKKLPGSRYVVLVRNPVEMAYALHEQMSCHLAEHVLDFEKAWNLSPLRRKGEKVRPWVLAEPRMLDYQSVCKVGEQLERLYNQVPPERVLVLLLDDIKEDTRREYLKLLDFLNVPDDNRSNFPVANSAKGVRWRKFQLMLALAMKGERVIKGKLGFPMVNSTFLKTLNGLNKPARKRPSLSSNTWNRLVDYYSDDIMKLQNILERDLSKWLKKR
ncbi:MAG: sulfotransferase [Bacteroidetes bacterium]|nr:MAG: sulfotransferase [Bacteroidota bacterium]